MGTPDLAMFSVLQVTARPICDLNACSDAPGRLMQMASVHVGTDTDYSFTNRKDERAALLASRHHGVKAQQRGFLAETTAAHPVATGRSKYAYYSGRPAGVGRAALHTRKSRASWWSRASCALSALGGRGTAQETEFLHAVTRCSQACRPAA